MEKREGTKQALILSQRTFDAWVNALGAQFSLFGPVLKKKSQTIFQKIGDSGELNLDYCSTMLSPRSFIYPSRQKLFEINRQTGEHRQLLQLDGKKIVFAIHPCDMHAISVLDRIFLGDFKDVYYRTSRENVITIVLNCNHACDQGFCASMGTGPFLQLKNGFDIVMTTLPVNEDHEKTAKKESLRQYLLEFVSDRSLALAEKIEEPQDAQIEDFEKKREIEEHAKASFKKSIDTNGLVELLMANLDHPVYKHTADSRCLGCTNCTMVCPTCYCYNIEEYTGYDLKMTERSRYWDSCQELNFAKVHEGNFRSSREARLRQFVTHKLATWIEQYGCFGCIGCGRCMTWCPTGIDLTEMAKEIQQDKQAGKI